MNLLDDPELNLDDWIDTQLQITQGMKVSDSEAACNRLLTQLQLNSRELSQIASTEIEKIIGSLPEVMAHLSLLQTEVEGISESIRTLTNEAYSYRSEAVPEQLASLSATKSQRDRLKIAAEKLKAGNTIENNLREFENKLETEPITNLCDDLERIQQSAAFLIDIKRFEGTLKRIDLLKIEIVKKLDSLMMAEVPKNPRQFSELVKLSKRICTPTHHYDVVCISFKNMIKESIDYLINDDIGIALWYEHCLSNCISQLKFFVNWCLDVRPRVFDSSIREQLFLTIPELLNKAIEAQTRDLLTNNHFDDLSKVIQMSQEMWKALPADWKLSSDAFRSYLSGFQYVRGNFEQCFMKYLASLKTTQVPKSQTGTTQKPRITEPERTLDEILKIVQAAIDWISNIPENPSSCITALIDFFKEAIQKSCVSTSLKIKGLSNSFLDKALFEAAVNPYHQGKEQLQLCLSLEESLGIEDNAITDTFQQKLTEVFQSTVWSLSKSVTNRLTNVHDKLASGRDISNEIQLISRDIDSLLEYVANSGLDDSDKSLLLETVNQNVIAEFIEQLEGITAYGDDKASIAQYLDDIEYSTQYYKPSNSWKLDVAKDLFSSQEKVTTKTLTEALQRAEESQKD